MDDYFDDYLDDVSSDAEPTSTGTIRDSRQEFNARRIKEAATYSEAIKVCEKVMAKYSKALKDLE